MKKSRPTTSRAWCHLGIRIEPQTRDALDAAAERDGVSISDYLRRLIAEAVKEPPEQARDAA